MPSVRKAKKTRRVFPSCKKVGGPKNKGGRPTVMTPEVIRKLEEVFIIGGSDGEACFFANISRVTLWEYEQRHPEFTSRKEQLKERPILLARQVLLKGIVGEQDKETKKWIVQPNPDLAIKYLERKKRKEFATRIENEVEGQIRHFNITITKQKDAGHSVGANKKAGIGVGTPDESDNN